MELKGFKRRSRTITIAAASCGMLASAIGFTTPMAAAQDAGALTWEMPDLKEEVLQNAVDSVLEVAGPGNVEFNLADTEANQVIYNYTNWVVCAQSPTSGKLVKVNPEKPQQVYFNLKRRAGGC